MPRFLPLPCSLAATRSLPRNLRSFVPGKPLLRARRSYLHANSLRRARSANPRTRNRATPKTRASAPASTRGTALDRLALRAHGQARDSRHFGIGIAAAGGDVRGRHRRRVGAPEQLFADQECRYAEYPACNGLVGVPAPRVLDLGAGDAFPGIGDSELGGQLGPFDRQIPEAPVAPDETEDPAHGFGFAVC